VSTLRYECVADSPKPGLVDPTPGKESEGTQLGKSDKLDLESVANDQKKPGDSSG